MMRTVSISAGVPEASVIGIGCMRISSLTVQEVERLIDSSLDLGINFFDHADIYAGGECETFFGRAMTAERRNRMVLQTKCAIRPGICYDFSKDYILQSVDHSLQRLHTDHIDTLLLHRPDALMEPEEVAEAFNTLRREGKVTAFGMSNANPSQIELLNAYCGNAIVIDQIQFSIAHCPSVDAGLNVNIAGDAACDRTGSILEYCRLKNIRPQAWSPFQYGMFEGLFIGSDKYQELNKVMERLAEKYHASVNAIAVAWILRHPAGIQTIVGSTNPERIRGISKAGEITLTREEWYELYLAAGKQLP